MRLSKFTLTINCETEAFSADNPGRELKRILTDIAKEVGKDGALGGNIEDANGMNVGGWRIDVKADDDPNPVPAPEAPPSPSRSR